MRIEVCNQSLPDTNTDHSVLVTKTEYRVNMVRLRIGILSDVTSEIGMQ
jgi:hypothetical protein